MEVAALGYIVKAAEESGVFRAQNLLHLFRSPDEELAFLAFAIGILRRIESAVRRGHWPATRFR